MATLLSTLTHPSEQQTAEIAEWARLGLCSRVIAAIFTVTEESLLACCAKEIDQALRASQKAVLSSLYKLAESGKNVSATIFWLKTFASHLLATEPAKDTAQKPPDAEPQPLGFYVYNNDGEPNADY